MPTACSNSGMGRKGPIRVHSDDVVNRSLLYKKRDVVMCTFSQFTKLDNEILSKSFGNIFELKYLGMTMTDENYVYYQGDYFHLSKKWRLYETIILPVILYEKVEHK